MNNHFLKRAREAAGLSQDDLASAIGTTASTISGWERHEHQPSAYFREKLCSALGKSATELGLLPPEGASALSSTYDPFIPIPVTLVGRSEQIVQLRQQLQISRSTFSVLLGLPGVGKTALAVTLAYDQKIRKHFRDGILWAGLGPSPNIPGLLSHWGKLLGLSATEMVEIPTKEAWIEILRSTIGNRSMLLVIDDAWKLEDVLSCHVGGPNCTYLLTTRFPEIAARITINGMTRIEELNAKDGMALLRMLAPRVVEREEAKAETLVEAVGGLPLALTLMGNYLRKEGYSGQSRRIQTALKRLSDGKGRLSLSEPRTPVDSYCYHPDKKTISLRDIIAVADQHLPEKARQTLYALAILPTKPHTFSEETALAVAASSVEILDTLIDSGLLESCGEDRYNLHQTIADYAHMHMEGRTAHERFIAYVMEAVEQWETDYEILEKECSTVLMALEIAHALQKHAELIKMVSAFVPFLIERGMAVLARRCVRWMNQSATATGDSESTVHALHYLEQLE